jgi:hypothetical protein
MRTTELLTQGLFPALCCSAVGSGPYGEVSGSSPSWRANFADRGRSHATGPAADFGKQGFAGWDASSPVGEPPLRRHIEQPASSSYTEPVVRGTANSSYYQRRAGGDAEAYRRTLKHVPEPVRVDRCVHVAWACKYILAAALSCAQRPEGRRCPLALLTTCANYHDVESARRPEGKRAIPEPYGAPPAQPRGTRPPPDDVRFRQSDSAPEPNLPRLGRPEGISGLRESSTELTFEKSTGIKVKVGPHAYTGLGRAGACGDGAVGPCRAATENQHEPPHAQATALSNWPKSPLPPAQAT